MNHLVKVRYVTSIGDEQTSQEIITHADFSGDADDYTLIYHEDMGNILAETVIRVLGGECVSVRRKAEMQTDMMIEVGKKHISEHKLPFGSFNLEVIGNHVKSSFGEKCTELQFAYTTYQDNEPVNKADFQITVKRKGQISV